MHVTGQANGEVVKRGIFKRIEYSSARRYFCEKGELTLTTENLIIDCEGRWTKTFPLDSIRLEASKDNLEVYNLYHKLRFKVAIDKPKEWKDVEHKLGMEKSDEAYLRIWEDKKEIPREVKKLLDLTPNTLWKLYNDTLKERQQYERENIKFNLDIQKSWLSGGIKSRKLIAFIVAHSYVAWYEWTKKLLYKIHRVKFGKGPDTDEDLMRFLDDYPSLRHFMDTSKWGIEANQIRNCVSHEKFYFDYKSNELVFMKKKEKRIKPRELKRLMFLMADFYRLLLDSIKAGIAKEETS